MKVMPRTRFGVWWRAVLAGVVVVACAAGAVATAGLLEVKNIVQVINLQKPIVSKELTLPAPGKPENLLLVGVDHRYGQGHTAGNTDTMMLVRINDASATINTLSIPRDLWVDVPGYGYEKINAAYSERGPNLLIRTLREDVFPSLKIQHLLIVDFASFANLINAIGCVYVQSDQLYYNHSIGAANPTTDYSSIDIEPGYQRLCGGSGSNLGGANTALAFVRFRHNDSDFVRQARQQDFLRWAKQNFSTSRLLSERSTLLNDFAKDVQTDQNFHTNDGVLELFDLAVNANGSAQKSFPFPLADVAQIGNTSNLSFSEAAAEQTYRAFMRPTIKKPAPPATTAPPATPATGGHSKGKGRKHVAPGYQLPGGMAADPNDGNSQATALGHPGLPVYYPLDIPQDYSYCSTSSGNCDIGYEVQANPNAYHNAYPRHYSILATDGKRYPSYVMTLAYTSGGYTDIGTGEYATVEGTAWPGAGHEAGPPLLKAPTLIRRVNGKVLYEYSQGGKLAVVAWKTPTAVYWISNTLQNNIPNVQMIAMAASFTRA